VLQLQSIVVSFSETVRENSLVDDVYLLPVVLDVRHYFIQQYILNSLTYLTEN